MPSTFSVDYDVGWAGFTNTGGAIADAIGYGERWDRLEAKRGTPTVTHAFVVIAPGVGVEAHLETGVARFALSKYWNDPKCKLYFRRPRGWTPEMGLNIAARAQLSPPLGHPYDKSLIEAMALSYSVLGHGLSLATRGWFKRMLCMHFSTPYAYICSEAVAYIYQQFPELKDKGCLKQPACTIDPQQLFGTLIRKYSMGASKVTPLQANQALRDAGGNFHAAAAALGIETVTLHDVVERDPALTKRWKEPPKAPPPSSIMHRADDVSIAEAIQREEARLKEGVDQLGLSERAKSLALACQRFQRNNFNSVLQITSGGITKAFLEALEEIENINQRGWRT